MTHSPRTARSPPNSSIRHRSRALAANRLLPLPALSHSQFRGRRPETLGVQPRRTFRQEMLRWRVPMDLLPRYPQRDVFRVGGRRDNRAAAGVIEILLLL